MTTPAFLWLQRRRLTDPARTDRWRFSTTLAEIADAIGEPEPAVVEALTAAGYTVQEGKVDMARFYWRGALGPPARDDATRRTQIDRIAAAWAQQLGTGSVGTALELGGELRAAIKAAILPNAPNAPSASALAKLIRHGQARGHRYEFHLVAETPRRYGVRRRKTDHQSEPLYA